MTRQDVQRADRIRRVLLRQPRAGSDIMTLDDVERAYIVSALELCRGNQSLTARRLGIGRTTMRRRIRSLKLKRMLKDLERDNRASRAR